MPEPFIFINTYSIADGKLADYEKAAEEWFEWVSAKHHRVLHHMVYLSDDGTEVTNVQIHPDADSMELMLTIIAERHAEWQEYVDFSRMSVVVCGIPGDAVTEQMRQIGGAGVPVTVKAPLAGFSLLPEG
jgi:hypothetical protein